MAQVVNMKRFGALVMALLVVLAVAGPVCLMFASSAMAMPMEVDSSPCDQDSGSVVCPYAQPDSVAGATAPTVAPLAAVDVLPVDDALGLGAAGFVLIESVPSPDAPPSSPAPLRI